MAIEVSRPLLTYDDYAAFPDDGERYELIDGELILTPSPTTRHQMLCYRLAQHLLTYLDDNQVGLAIGDVDTTLSRHTTLRPDFAFYRQERLHVIGERRIQGAPDLAIEVLSPSNARMDLWRKRVLYSEHGSQEYWIVHQAQVRVDVFRSVDGSGLQEAISHNADGLLESPLLPGFSLPLARLYRDLL